VSDITGTIDVSATQRASQRLGLDKDQDLPIVKSEIEVLTAGLIKPTNPMQHGVFRLISLQCLKYLCLVAQSFNTVAVALIYRLTSNLSPLDRNLDYTTRPSSDKLTKISYHRIIIGHDTDSVERYTEV